MTGRIALTLLVPLLLAGCAVGPDYERPQQSAPLPADWTDRAAGQQTMPMSAAGQLSMAAALPDTNQGDHWRWWTEFADTTLNGLVNEALLHNNNLAVAAGRVLEARALHGGSQSARWPTVEIGGTAARAKSNQLVTGIPISPYGNVFDASANLNFEVDLWGRLSRGEEAARATLLASEQDRRAVAQGLIAEVVRSWLAIRELHLQVALTQRTITNFQHNLTTVRERYRRGLVSPLDVYLAEQNLASAQAVGPLFERQLVEAKRRLQILVGRYPSGAILASDLDDEGGYLSVDIMPAPLSPVPAGLPSELLDRRPDLQAAEMRLHASVARIGQAKAALYPRLSLTAGAGTKSRELSDLFTQPTEVWNIAGNLFMPLINRGATQAQIKAATARAEQATANYRESVLTAFAEVENALDQDIYQSQQEFYYNNSAVHAKRAVDLAEDRYRRGLDSLLITLESQRRLFNAESQLLATQRARRTARVNLIQALGGPWESPNNLTISAQGASQ